MLGIVNRDPKGLYHTAGSERISRFEFASEIAKNFDLDSSLIKSISLLQLIVKYETKNTYIHVIGGH